MILQNLVQADFNRHVTEIAWPRFYKIMSKHISIEWYPIQAASHDLLTPIYRICLDRILQNRVQADSTVRLSFVGIAGWLEEAQLKST